MAGRRASRDAISREQWAAHLADAGAADAVGSRRGREPISVARIVSAALEVVREKGFEDLTMRSVASALDTGPASLYAHVRNKAELGDLLVGALCARVVVPVADPARWQEQFLDVCSQLREQFLDHPGVAQAALAVVPADLATLRVAEGMLGILLAGGASPRDAVWASDTAFLYVTAYCLELATARRQSTDVAGALVDRTEIAERLRMLPVEDFPHTVALVAELTAGVGHERFEFALRMLLRGLAADGGQI